MDYKQILEDINRQLNGVNLMVVSKTRTIDEIMCVYNAGARLFGENHVQEIVEKFSLSRPSDMKVHMIGHLQRNKVNKVVPLVDMIESVDSWELLEKINKASEKLNKIMPVLLELNTSGESSKSGFANSDELKACLEKSQILKNVDVRGFMTVGPVSCLPEDKDNLTRKAFRILRDLFLECKDRYSLDTLSMGMSGDYRIGVEEGSTQVRIGTLIFGERQYV